MPFFTQVSTKLKDGYYGFSLTYSVTEKDKEIDDVRSMGIALSAITPRMITPVVHRYWKTQTKETSTYGQPFYLYDFAIMTGSGLQFYLGYKDNPKVYTTIPDCKLNHVEGTQILPKNMVDAQPSDRDAKEEEKEIDDILRNLNTMHHNVNTLSNNTDEYSGTLNSTVEHIKAETDKLRHFILTGKSNALKSNLDDKNNDSGLAWSEHESCINSLSTKIKSTEEKLQALDEKCKNLEGIIEKNIANETEKKRKYVLVKKELMKALQDSALNYLHYLVALNDNKVDQAVVAKFNSACNEVATAEILKINTTEQVMLLGPRTKTTYSVSISFNALNKTPENIARIANRLLRVFLEAPKASAMENLSKKFGEMLSGSKKTAEVPTPDNSATPSAPVTPAMARSMSASSATTPMTAPAITITAPLENILTPQLKALSEQSRAYFTLDDNDFYWENDKITFTDPAPALEKEELRLNTQAGELVKEVAALETEFKTLKERAIVTNREQKDRLKEEQEGINENARVIGEIETEIDKQEEAFLAITEKKKLVIQRSDALNTQCASLEMKVFNRTQSLWISYDSLLKSFAELEAVYKKVQENKCTIPHSAKTQSISNEVYQGLLRTYTAFKENNKAFEKALAKTNRSITDLTDQCDEKAARIKELNVILAAKRLASAFCEPREWCSAVKFNFDFKLFRAGGGKEVKNEKGQVVLDAAGKPLIAPTSIADAYIVYLDTDFDDCASALRFLTSVKTIFATAQAERKNSYSITPCIPSISIRDDRTIKLHSVVANLNLDDVKDVPIGDMMKINSNWRTHFNRLTSKTVESEHRGLLSPPSSFNVGR